MAGEGISSLTVPGSVCAEPIFVNYLLSTYYVSHTV